jgi:hypothetical protein
VRCSVAGRRARWDYKRFRPRNEQCTSSNVKELRCRCTVESVATVIITDVRSGKKMSAAVARNQTIYGSIEIA